MKYLGYLSEKSEWVRRPNYGVTCRSTRLNSSNNSTFSWLFMSHNYSCRCLVVVCSAVRGQQVAFESSLDTAMANAIVCALVNCLVSCHAVCGSEFSRFHVAVGHLIRPDDVLPLYVGLYCCPVAVFVDQLKNITQTQSSIFNETTTSRRPECGNRAVSCAVCRK